MQNNNPIQNAISLKVVLVQEFYEGESRVGLHCQNHLMIIVIFCHIHELFTLHKYYFLLISTHQINNKISHGFYSIESEIFIS